MCHKPAHDDFQQERELTNGQNRPGGRALYIDRVLARRDSRDGLRARRLAGDFGGAADMSGRARQDDAAPATTWAISASASWAGRGSCASVSRTEAAMATSTTSSVTSFTSSADSGQGIAAASFRADENKSTVTSEKKEVFLMLDKMNIQVDNIVAVLDQENSKNFIRGSEKQKFQFFQNDAPYPRKSSSIFRSARQNIGCRRKRSHASTRSSVVRDDLRKRRRRSTTSCRRRSGSPSNQRTPKSRRTWAYVDEAEEPCDHQDLNVRCAAEATAALPASTISSTRTRTASRRSARSQMSSDRLGR